MIYDYNDKMAVKDKLFTPLNGVRLNDGLFRDVFENNKQFLDTLDMGAMMYWFDIKTDTPTTAQPYKGHFEDNLKGSTLSMFLMGAANTLRWCDDDNLAAKIDILMERLTSAAESDGFLMPVDKTRFALREYPHYVRIWLTYALIAVGTSHNPEAWDVLRKWQDWFNSCIDLPIIKYLELAFQGIVASTVLYTTPIGRYEDIAVTIDAYEEPWRLAQFMRRERDCVHIRKQPGTEPHAHGSELEGIEGYLDLYRATGRNYYLDAVLGAWELYRADWQHAGGGIVMCEGMPTNYPGCNWLNPKNHYNELCCTSFWLYLNLRLHRLFPDNEAYMSEVEKSLYNIAIANQDGGDGIRYFGYLEEKKQESGKVHCCCGVGTRIFGSLPEYVYSVSDDSIAVNLYTPSELDHKLAKIKLDAELPYRTDVKITVSEPVGAFKLRLRIPDWTASHVNIILNGESIMTAKSGTYAVIDRVWNDGDIIEYGLPQTFRLTLYSGADEIGGFDRYYIEYGAILYAVTAPTFKEARIIGWSADDFMNWLIPTDDPLTYKIAMHDTFKLVPYYMLDSNTEFTCCPIFGGSK